MFRAFRVANAACKDYVGTFRRKHTIMSKEESGTLTSNASGKMQNLAQPDVCAQTNA